MRVPVGGEEEDGTVFIVWLILIVVCLVRLG